MARSQGGTDLLNLPLIQNSCCEWKPFFYSQQLFNWDTYNKKTRRQTGTAKDRREKGRNV